MSTGSDGSARITTREVYDVANRADKKLDVLIQKVDAVSDDVTEAKATQKEHAAKISSNYAEFRSFRAWVLGGLGVVGAVVLPTLGYLAVRVLSLH